MYVKFVSDSLLFLNLKLIIALIFLTNTVAAANDEFFVNRTYNQHCE